MTDPATEMVVNPGTAVVVGVERVLELAATWLGWNGAARVSEDGDRIYTPHKAVRRHADHLIDHLAQVGALLSGVDPLPDEWRGSLVTVDSDWSRFTEVDLNEARQRLRRLARTFELRLAEAGSQEWDCPRGHEWTLREIAEHVAAPWYAEQVGDLGTQSAAIHQH